MKNVSHNVSFRALAGLTVVEVLIGLTAIAIVAMLSAPVIDGLLQEHYLKKTSANLLSSLTLAQNEAARRGSIAKLCPSSDGKSCRPDGDWNQGWIVFVDSNANHVPEAVEIVEVYGPPKGAVRVEANDSFSSSAEFSFEGLLIDDHQQGNGKFRLCYGDQKPGYREILVDARGRAEVRQSEEDCGKS